MRTAGLLVFVILTGCGGGDGQPSDSQSTRALTAPEFGLLVESIAKDYAALAAFSPPTSLPTSGTMDFIGGVAFDVAGETPGTAIGNLRITASFADTQLSGAADGFVFLFQGEMGRPAGGALQIAGEIIGLQVEAEATGTLGIPPEDASESSLHDVRLALMGGFHGLEASVLGLAGTISGTVKGGERESIASGIFAVSR